MTGELFDPARMALEPNRESTIQITTAPMSAFGAFRETGGLVPWECLRGNYIIDSHGNAMTLESALSSRRLVRVVHRERLLVPSFQFEGGALRWRVGTQEVLDELRGAYDDDEIAMWFSTPSPWLDGSTPAKTLAWSFQSVIAAARVDRYVVRG